MSTTIHIKAKRLLRDGLVDPDLSPATVFRTGDHGSYLTVVSAHVQLCNCPAAGDCAHKHAAVLWLLADDQQRTRNLAALEARKAAQRSDADELFREARMISGEPSFEHDEPFGVDDGDQAFDLTREDPPPTRTPYAALRGPAPRPGPVGHGAQRR